MTDPPPWRRSPLPTLPPTPLRYLVPSGGLDPFDLAEDRTQWFVEARGYGLGWVAEGDGRTGPSWSQAHRDIPMGYRYLAIIEKLAIVVGGELVRTWAPLDVESKFVDKRVRPYAIFGQHREPSEGAAPLTLAQPTGTSVSDPDRSGAETYQEAVRVTLELPPRSDAAYLIGRVLLQTSWH